MHIKQKYYIDLLKNGRYSWRKTYLFFLRETPRWYRFYYSERKSWETEKEAEMDLIESIKENAFRIKRKKRSTSYKVPPFKNIG